MKFNLILSLFFVFQSILVVNSQNVCNDFVGISPSITLDNYPSPGEWPGNSGCIIGDLNCSRILNSPNSNVYLSQSWMTNDISYLYFRTDFKSQATLTNSKSLVLCLESTTSSGLNTVSLCPYSGKPSYLAIVRLVGVNLNLRAIFVNCDQANCNNITQLLQNNNTEIYKPLLINNLTSSSVSHLEFAIPLAYFASDFSSLFVNSFLMNASASANSVTFWESAQLDSVTYNKKCAGSQDSLRFCPFGTESVWQGIEVDGDSSDWPNQAKIDEDPNTGTCLDFPPYSDTCPLCGADNAESAFGLVPGKVDIVHQWSFNDEFSLNIDLQTYFYDSGIPSDPRTYTSGISIRQTSGFFVLCLGKQSSAGSQNYPLCPGFDTDYQLVIMGTENSNMPFVALLLTCASFPINGALGCSQTMSDVVSSVSNYMTTDFGQIKSVFQNAVHLAHAAVSGNSGSGWGSDLEISIPFRFLNVNFQNDLNTKFFFWAIGGNGTVLDYAPNRNPKNEADTEQPNPQDYAVLRCPSINQNGVCSAIAVGPYKTITLDNIVSDWPGNNACDSVEGTNSYCSLLGYDQKESQFSPDCQSGLRTVNSSNCLSAQSDIKGLWMTNDLLNLYVRVDFEAAPFSLTWPKFLAICISTNSPNVGPTLSPFCSAPITNPDFILFVSQGSVSGSPTAFKYVLKDCTKHDCTVTELTSVASVVGVNAGQIGCTGAQCSSNSNSIEMRIPFASLSRQNATRGGVVFAEANLFGSVSPLTLLDFAPDTTKTLPPFYVQCPSLQQCDKQAYVMESGNTFQTCQNKIAYAEFYQVSDRNFTTQFPNQTIKVCGISADGFTLFPGVNSETLSHYGMDVFIYEAGSVDLSGSYNLLAIKSFDPPLDPTVWNSMIPISATLISGRYYSLGFQIWKDSFGVDDVMPKSGLFTFPCRPSTVANSLLSLSQVLSEETNANSLLAKYQFQNATTGWQSPTGAQSYLSPNLLLRFSYSATSSISPTPAPAALSSTNQASKAPTFYNPSQNYGTQCNLVSNQFELSANWADDNIKFINGRFSGAAISYLSLVYGTTRTNAVKGAIGSATAGSQISVAFPENDPIIRMTVMMTGTNALQIVAAVTFQTASGKSRTLGRIPATGAVWNYNGTVSNPIIGLYGCRAGQNFATIYPMIRTAKPAYITEETNVGSADTSSDGTQQTAIIVGVLVGVFCLILLCVAIAYIVHRRKSHSGTQFYDK